MSHRPAAAFVLLAGLALCGPAGAAPGDGAPKTGGATAATGGPTPEPPLVVTMPDTQPVLPSGRVEMDPAQGPSTGNADKLEPNIDGSGGRAR